MSVLVRQLLYDLADNKLDIITRSDLCGTIQQLVNTAQVDTHDILCLDKYISGFSVTELELDWPNAKERLLKVLALIEVGSGYTDELFLQRVVMKYPKYGKNIEVARSKLAVFAQEL